MQNTEILPPVSTEAQSISEATEIGRRIGVNWQKAATQVLDTASLCLTALERYASHGLPAVLRAANMSKPTFMKLVVIARDERLRRIEVQLPPGFSIIYEVSQLSDEVFEQAVKAELIHPHVRRAEIQELRKAGGGEGKQDRKHSELPAALRELAAGGRFEFMVPRDIGAAACEEMRQIVHGLQKKFGVEIATLKASETAANGAVIPPVSSGSGSSPVNERPLVRIHPAAATKAK
jgi:hypothetical protein